MNPKTLPQSKGRRFGYARVSTKDQRLRMQTAALKDADCTRIFSDHGVSGKKSKRPGLDEMLKLIKPGDTIVVLKLDRLGRSVQHLAQLLMKFRDENIHLHSLTEGIDTSTPGGKFIYHVISACAEFQRDIIVENTLLGLEAARANGSRFGRPPILGEDDVARAYEHVVLHGLSVSAVAQDFDVSAVTLTRAFKKFDLRIPHYQPIERTMSC